MSLTIKILVERGLSLRQAMWYLPAELGAGQSIAVAAEKPAARACVSEQLEPHQGKFPQSG